MDTRERRRASHGDRIDRRPSLIMLSVDELTNLPERELHTMRAVTETFAFRLNDYYASLIDWRDPADPIRRLVVPTAGELSAVGELDPSDEAANTQMQGLQHKYADTALLLVTDQCAAFCRYCFRKRLFLPGSRETSRATEAALTYIAEHTEITDVLLTGGDPLSLPTKRLAEIVDAAASIEHVRTVRIGSKIPAFNPYRITEDAELLALVRRHYDNGMRIHFMCHFDHPRELTEPAIAALRALQENGAVTVNQCPVTAGVNDDAAVLAELFAKCTEAGCPQYYAFQCRPTRGNSSFSVPLTRSFELVNKARTLVSGLSRRARFCISHTTGKIEIVGVDDSFIFARYHRAKDPAHDGKMLVFHRDDSANWLDELVPAF